MQLKAKVKATFGEIKSKGGDIKSVEGIPLLNAKQRANRRKDYIEGLYECEQLPAGLIQDEKYAYMENKEEVVRG